MANRKIGRPRKDNPRKFSISVNLTKEEYDEVCNHAYQKELSASHLVRQVLRQVGIMKHPFLAC